MKKNRNKLYFQDIQRACMKNKKHEIIYIYTWMESSTGIKGAPNVTLCDLASGVASW